MNDYTIEDIDLDKVPKHIAIIMDGNGRWAKSRLLPRSAGHVAGVEAIRGVVEECATLGIKHLTLYAFSTENWKRPQKEVDTLMSLLQKYLRNEAKKLHNNNVKVTSIGFTDKLPEVCQVELRNIQELTKNNTGVNLNLALNYGARADISKAITKIVSDFDNGKLYLNEIDDNTLKNYLFTKNIPDPDLVIRTSGEQRLSNFLLWEIAYAELYFTDIHWPDFKAEDLYKAIITYQKRDRRFGGINK